MPSGRPRKSKKPEAESEAEPKAGQVQIQVLLKKAFSLHQNLSKKVTLLG